MSLARYAVKRLITGTITLIVVIIINFFLFRLPIILFGVDPAVLYGLNRLQQQNPNEKPEVIEQLIQHYRERWNVPSRNDPPQVWLQHLMNYLRRMFTFDFGESIFTPRKPVLELLAERVPITVLLIGLATLFSIMVGMQLGVYLAKKPASKLDQFMVGSTMALYAVPTFWIQIMFIYFFAAQLRMFPVKGGISTYQYSDPLFRFFDLLYLFTLPVITLTVASYGGWLLLTRNSLIDVMTEDYILTARAKGLDERTILYKHAFRNAILPLVTSIVLAIADVWTGAVITETIFNIPGVGQLLLISVLNQNYPLAEMLFFFIALSTIIANIVADISYAILDPRVRYK